MGRVGELYFHHILCHRCCVASLADRARGLAVPMSSAPFPAVCLSCGIRPVWGICSPGGGFRQCWGESALETSSVCCSCRACSLQDTAGTPVLQETPAAQGAHPHTPQAPPGTAEPTLGKVAGSCSVSVLASQGPYGKANKPGIDETFCVFELGFGGCERLFKPLSQSRVGFVGKPSSAGGWGERRMHGSASFLKVSGGRPGGIHMDIYQEIIHLYEIVCDFR